MRSRLRGPHPDDRELSVRIFRALGVGIGLGLTYAAALGSQLASAVRDPQVLLAQPRLHALAAAALIFVVPASLGVLAHCIYLSSIGVVERVNSSGVWISCEDVKVVQFLEQDVEGTDEGPSAETSDAEGGVTHG